MSSSTKELKHIQIPLQEISLATNHFSEENKIAAGGFGTVYRGESDKHGIIAVKRLVTRENGQGNHEFLTEIKMLSSCEHENIVYFHGFAYVTKYQDDRVFLSVLAQKHYKRQTLEKIIHSDLQNQINAASLHTFSTIANQCFKNADDRPTMKEVVKQLERALSNQLAPSGIWSDVYDGFSDAEDGDFVALQQSEYLFFNKLFHSFPQTKHSLEIKE
ncbi:receptor-like protein kinase HERK 1 [Tanacetum coccineum]